MIKYIKNFFNNLFNKKVVKEVVVEVQVIRLQENVYNQLEKSCPNTLLGAGDSAELASYKLGVAHTLAKIRQGITI